MTYIGFEWVAQQTLSVLPNNSFTIAIIWEGRKITSSIGKDTYLNDTLLLPNTIISATGRIHHENRLFQQQWDGLNSKACHPIKSPNKLPSSLHVEIVIPSAFPSTSLERLTCFHFVKKHRKTLKVPLFFDPQAIQVIESTQLKIDLTPIILKHLRS